MGGRPSAARPFSNHGWIMETMEMTAAELTPPRPMISRPMLVSAAFATAILLIVMWAVLRPGMPHAQIAHEAQSMSMIWIAPFALLLAAIATMPFINKHWWEKYYPAVSLGLAALAAG